MNVQAVSATSYTVCASVLVQLIFAGQVSAANIALYDHLCFSLEFLFPRLEERKVLRLWLLMGKRQLLIIVGFVFWHAANLHYIKETTLQMTTCKVWDEKARWNHAIKTTCKIS